MKNQFFKKLSLLALCLAFVLLLSACGADGGTNSDDKASSNDGISQLESDLMPSQNNDSQPNENYTSSNAQQNSQNNTLSETAEISKEEAKKIALKDAGFKESEIKNLKIESDRDDGVLHYDISFEKDGSDYDYEIDAKTGKILDIEKDIAD